MQFYGELYTGERAEMKPTSVRLPAGFLQDIDTVCKYHEGAAGREFAKAMQQEVPAMSRSEFISSALVDQISNTLLEDRGGLLLKVENPQQYKKPTEETRAEIMQILADVAALKIDERAGFRTGVMDLVNYLFEKLCKENNGEQFTENYIYNAELAEMRKNAKKEG